MVDTDRNFGSDQNPERQDQQRGQGIDRQQNQQNRQQQDDAGTGADMGGTRESGAGYGNNAEDGMGDIDDGIGGDAGLGDRGGDQR